MEPNMSKKLTKDQEKIVIDIYHKCHNLSETARRCGFLSHKSVANVLARNNIEHISLIPKYEKNTNLFKKINKEENAYFLGLLMSDGNNYIKRKGNYQISIKLQESDKHILEKLRDLIIPNKLLDFCPKKQPQHSNYFRLKFDSKIISNQLINLGCIEAKSLTLRFPEFIINSPYLNHFIRGYFDGNGSISFWTKQWKSTKNKNYVWSLVSSNEFSKIAKQIIEDKFNLNINSRISNKINGNFITTTISAGGNRQVAKILDWLYQDATLYLSRKYNKYLELKKQNKYYDELFRT
jgi:intein/homing endonuclease